MCCTSKIGVPKFRGKLISTSVKATGPPVDAPIITTSRRLLRLGCAGGGAGSRRGGAVTVELAVLAGMGAERKRPLLNESRRSCSLSVKSFERWETSDRKSTRLNSSHVAISYAVFCLKN